MNLSQLLSGIADAIREVDGTTTPIAALDFPARIRMIEELIPPKIYGAEWDGTATTAWIRTDDAAGFAEPVPAVANGAGSSPFDTLYPWSGVVRVADETAGELVAIPKFWYKWTKTGASLKLQISDKPVEGFYTSPAHADRDDGVGERDMVYIGRYHSGADYKSTTDTEQKAVINRATARAGIHSLGATIWQSDYALRVTIWMLYLVEFADWNSQAKIGYGCSASGAKENNGKTDAMQYHTGTTAANQTTYGFTQYRNIEGLWDNVSDWMDGCYFNENGMYVITKPSAFSDTNGGTFIGKPCNGGLTAFTVPTISDLEWAICPSADASNDGTYSTYIADGWAYDTSFKCPYCGGCYQNGQWFGLFFVGGMGSSASARNDKIGCRLMKLP